jgi:hypothetical protein
MLKRSNIKVILVQPVGVNVQGSKYTGAACRGQCTRFKTARTTVSGLMRNEIVLKKVCVRICTGHAELCYHNQRDRERERGNSADLRHEYRN